MKRILIDVSTGELNFIREALEIKHINLMSYFDACEENGNLTPTLEKVRTKTAPYGLKKDGTPKVKPGRKA
jgi:hypothetical protein